MIYLASKEEWEQYRQRIIVVAMLVLRRWRLEAWIFCRRTRDACHKGLLCWTRWPPLLRNQRLSVSFVATFCALVSASR